MEYSWSVDGKGGSGGRKSGGKRSRRLQWSWVKQVEMPPNWEYIGYAYLSFCPKL